MNIFIFSASLQAGGKERRIVELLKHLCQDSENNVTLVLLNSNIHYKEVFNLPVNICYINSVQFLKRIFDFYKIYRLHKPDIIHTWDNITSMITIPIRICFSVKWLNGQVTTAPKHPIQYGLGLYLGSKLAFTVCDHIVANSNAGLKSFNTPKRKSSLVYNGFNFQRLVNLEPASVIRDKLQIDTTFIVGMVASFSKWKDYPTFVRAAEIMLSERSDVTFLCIGAGSSIDIQEMILPSQKKFFRFLPKQENVESIMNICDVGVLVSRGSHEGLSNVILEFLALSKPVVATNGGGTFEIINNGVTGFLVPNSDQKALADRIVDLLGNPLKRKVFGENGKLKVQQEFNIQNMITLYEKLYQSLLI